MELERRNLRRDSPASDERHQEQDEKQKEQDLCDPSRRNRYSTESENRRDDREDKKNNSVMQHKLTSL
jgi:hypothetical protein